ncbi:MAG: EAL domain-containing protein [Campylobacterales bacterium]|nr:EAL domain-containing protein [Campylobacterales bacterium]
MLSINKKLFQYSKTSRKMAVFILLILFLSFIYTTYKFFEEFKNKASIKAKNEYSLNIKYIDLKLKEYLLINDREKIDLLIKNSFKTKYFKSISIKYKKFMFNKNTLLHKSSSFNDKSWILGEVLSDARYGYIEKIHNSMIYEFIAYDSLPNLNLGLSFKVFKRNEIHNYFTILDFSNILLKDSIKKDSSFYLFIDKILNLKIEKEFISHILSINDIDFASVKYEVDTSIVKYEIYELLIKLLLISFVLFIPIIILIVFYHNFVFRKYVKVPLTYLNNYLEGILVNKYESLDKSKFENFSEFKRLTKQINKIGAKTASLTNQLSINKEIMDRRMSIDILTGLSNKSVFELETKLMFVNSNPGIVFYFKIELLADMHEKHDNEYINNFIKIFINNIKNSIYKFDKLNTTIYRFYGSEFAIISKNMTKEVSIELSKEIIINLNKDISEKFDMKSNIINIGLCKFDIYGNLNSLLHNLNDSYLLSKDDKYNSFHFLDEEEEQNKLDYLIEDVKDIILNKNIDLKTSISMYLFDDINKLIMKEVSALVYDKNAKKISIGSFLTIASSLKLTSNFDKIIIEKSINLLKENTCSFSLVVNISFDSIKDKNFIFWLENILNENKELNKYLIFSITSYSAYSNKRLFKMFISKINMIGSKFLIKRYKLDEYPLSELKGLDIDYIRMAKEYTDNFSNDTNKKHKVKSILIFAELNNIEVIADMVALDEDFDLLERLGTYAISK